MARLTKPEVVVLTLYELDGQHKAVGTEEVAVKSVEIAPRTFGWQKYPDYIDKELVRTALRHGEEQGLVVGSHTKGWMLSETGVSRAARLSSAAKNDVVTSKSDSATEREKTRLKLTDAFRLMNERGADSVNREQALAFFRLTPYVAGIQREHKLTRIRNMFKADDEMAPVVEAMIEVLRVQGETE